MSDLAVPDPTRRSAWRQRFPYLANASPYPSRPNGGTLDPTHIPGFVLMLGEASTFEIAHRFGWAPQDAFSLCHGLRMKGLLTHRSEPHESGIVAVWRATEKALREAEL